MAMPQGGDKTEAEKSKPELIGTLLKEDTFVITSGVQRPEKLSAQGLRHRKALALAKANARHVIKSWQKRHQLLDNDISRRSGTSRAYIKHFSEAVQNEHGEKIYFRWEECGKINHSRQPKAVSKLYDYKKKRNAKRKNVLGDPESKSAPNRGAQDSLTLTSDDPKGLRTQTAVTDHQDHDDEGDRDREISKVPESSSSMGRFQNQSRKGKRVEFDLPPQTLRGIKEAFLSNSAKPHNQNGSNTTSSANSKNSNSGRGISLKSYVSDSEKIAGDGQTDSDKENITAMDLHQEHSSNVFSNVPIDNVSKLELEILSLNKEMCPSNKNLTESRGEVPPRSRPSGNKPTGVSSNDKRSKPRLPEPPTSKPNTQDSNSQSKNISRKEKYSKPSWPNNNNENNLKPKIFHKSTSNRLADVTITNEGNDDVTNLNESASESSLKSLGNRKGSVVKENLRNKSNLESVSPEVLDGKQSSQILSKGPDPRQTKNLSLKAKSKPNIERVKTNISKSQKSLYKSVEPSSADNKPLKLTNDSFNNPKTNHDKSANSIKEEAEMDRGYLNIIIESSSEPVPQITQTRLKDKSKPNSSLKSPNCTDVSDSDDQGKGRLLFKQTNGKHEKQSVGNWGRHGEETDTLISSLNKRQMTTIHGNSPGHEFDNRLSISWPKRRGKSVMSIEKRTLSRSDEKSYPSQRLDLTPLVNHQEEPNSPPLSINRDHHQPDDREGRGQTHVPNIIYKGGNQNISFSRKVSIDKTLDKGTPRSKATDTVKAEANVTSSHYFAKHSGTQSKHVGEDPPCSREKVVVADQCESGFQKSWNSDGQIELESNGGLLQGQTQIIESPSLSTTENSQRTDKSSFNLDFKAANVNIHHDGFTSSLPQGDDICDKCPSDFTNGKVIENFNEKGLHSETDTHSVKGEIGEGSVDGSVISISSDKRTGNHELPVITELTNETNPTQLTLLDRPVSAGMSQFLNRASPWMDERENVLDDDIKFINDEKDFYEVFGYDEETTELLQATQIFPVANFQDLGLSENSPIRSHDRFKQQKLKKISKPIGVLSTHIELEEKPRNVNHLGQKKSKFHSKFASSDVTSGLTVEKKDVVVSKDELQMSRTGKILMSQEEMKVKARERLLSLALRTESDDSLYRHGGLLTESGLQKGTHFDTVFVPMESSSSTSSLMTSKPLQVGNHPNNKNGEIPFQKANTSDIDLNNGIKNETEKLRRFSRKPVLDGVKVDFRHLPHDDLPLKRAPPPRPPPIYVAEPPIIVEPTHHAHPQIRPHLPHKHTSSKPGYFQRRRIFSESETERKKMEHFTSPSMTALYENANKPLSKNVGVGQNQNVPFPKKEYPQQVTQCPLNDSSHGQRGHTDTGQQFKKHVVSDVTGVTNTASTLLFNYSETAIKVKSRLIEHPSHKTNSTSHNLNTAIGKISNVNNNTSNNVASHQLTTTNNNNNSNNNNNYNNNNSNNKGNNNNSNSNNNGKTSVKHPETLVSYRDPGEKERPFKPLPNQHRTRQNEDRPQNGTSHLEDHLSLTKPRKLKPITHHPGVQKRHQHLASGL